MIVIIIVFIIIIYNYDNNIIKIIIMKKLTFKIDKITKNYMYCKLAERK